MHMHMHIYIYIHIYSVVFIRNWGGPDMTKEEQDKVFYIHTQRDNLLYYTLKPSVSSLIIPGIIDGPVDSD